jgi:hydroxymethylglutaryl-CoA lyase
LFAKKIEMQNQPSIKLIECPRDAMQGWHDFIPTADKIRYINTLLKVGFDTIDFGSFVSPKAIPQMADTKVVLENLDLSNTTSKLLAIVANKRGAEDAVTFNQIEFLGFPFSISETFQQRNTNTSIEQSYNQVLDIQDLCVRNNKKLVIYISMGFGNPYGDPYHEEMVFEWASKLENIGVDIISLADTVGLATPEQIERTTKFLINSMPNVEIGVHLHSSPINWKQKTEAAYNAGCIRFDGAINGIGGCPMAGDSLVGNMNTNWMIDFFNEKKISLQLDNAALADAIQIATEIFI